LLYRDTLVCSSAASYPKSTRTAVPVAPVPENCSLLSLLSVS
jgi:hypothetical protein